MVTQSEGERYIVVNLQFGQVTYQSEKVPLDPGPVNLQITGDTTTFTFSYSQNGDEFRDIETIESKFMSSETVGWFTGTYAGLYATGNGTVSESNADFDWFEYVEE